MLDNIIRTAVLALSLLALLASSGCVSDYWYDPVYFGDGEDLGKHSGGSGTGGEIWKFDWF